MRMLYLLMFLSISTYVSGQNCVPDPNITEPGIYPSALPSAEAGKAYSEAIHFMFPKDTSVFTIDSARIMKVDNMPPTFTYACNVSGCTYKGGDKGCLVIVGDPTTAMIGSYMLKITVELFTGGSSFTMTDSIEFDVVASTSNRLSSNHEFKIFQNNPNPFSRKTQIVFSLPASQNAEFIVIDLLGNEVYKQQVNGKAGVNSLTFYADNLAPGFYLYQIKSNNKILTRRMCVKHE